MYTNEIFSEELYTSIYKELLGECKTKYGFSEQIAGGKDTSVATTAIIGYCLHRIGILKESAQEDVIRNIESFCQYDEENDCVYFRQREDSVVWGTSQCALALIELDGNIIKKEVSLL